MSVHPRASLRLQLFWQRLGVQIWQKVFTAGWRSGVENSERHQSEVDLRTSECNNARPFVQNYQFPVLKILAATPEEISNFPGNKSFSG